MPHLSWQQRWGKDAFLSPPINAWDRWERWSCGHKSGSPMASYSTSETGCLYKNKLILQKHTRRLAAIGHYIITMLIVEEGMEHYKSLKTGKFSMKLCLLEIYKRLPPRNLMSVSSILLISLKVCFCETPHWFHYYSSIIYL